MASWIQFHTPTKSDNQNHTHTFQMGQRKITDVLMEERDCTDVIWVWALLSVSSRVKQRLLAMPST